MSNLAVVLLVLLFLLLVGAFPAWPHAQAWGYYPSGIFGLVLIVVIVLILLKKL